MTSVLAVAAVAFGLCGLIAGTVCGAILAEARERGTRVLAVATAVWRDPSGIAGPAEAAEAAEAASLPWWRQ